MGKDIAVQCARCEIKKCRDGQDCFSTSDNLMKLNYDTSIAGMHKVAVK